MSVTQAEVEFVVAVFFKGLAFFILLIVLLIVIFGGAS
jgi:hypothetical protein